LYNPVAISDDEILSDASLTLSTALDTAVLEASSRATDGNVASFTSESSDAAQIIKSKGKMYLLTDHTANQRKGAVPSWIWAHGDELRYLASNKFQKNQHRHDPDLN
jgi:hypothetical protein